MHLADAFIQSDLHCIQVTVSTSALAFPGNRTHDLGIASAMLYQLSYRKARAEGSYVGFGSPRQQVDMHEDQKMVMLHPKMCIKICGWRHSSLVFIPSFK